MSTNDYDELIKNMWQGPTLRLDTLEEIEERDRAMIAQLRDEGHWRDLKAETLEEEVERYRAMIDKWSAEGIWPWNDLQEEDEAE